MLDRPLWQKVTAVIAITAAIIWALYNYSFKGRLKSQNELKDSLAAIERQIDLIKPSNIILKGSLPVKEQIEKQLKEISKKIPSELDIPYLLEAFIIDSSKGLNIDYGLIQPLAPVQEGQYKKVPINVVMSADFENLNLYLARLDGLPITIRIDQMDIAKNTLSQTLDIKLALSAFVLPGGASHKKEAKANLAQIPSIDPFFSRAAAPKRGDITEAATGEIKALKRATALPKYKGIFKGINTKVFINSDIVGVGDSVGGFLVSDIKDKYVVVTKGRISYTLKLGR